MAFSGNAVYPTGAQVNIQFIASGGTPPYTWDFSPETSVPLGLSLDGYGLVSGYIADGSYQIVVVASDGLGQVGVDSLVIYMGVTPIVLPDTLPNTCVPAPYSYAIPASGGTAPYTFDLFEGSLPLGLSLRSDGVLEGTPTTPGIYAFTIHVVDSE